MPHQCTGCGHAFADGSKEMLSGCPECGGNKFQFRPEGSDLEEADPSASDPPEPPERDRPDTNSSVAETVGRATTRVRDFVSADPDTPEGEETPNPNAAWPSEEDTSAEASSQGETSTSDTPYPSSSDDSDSDIIDADARREAYDDSEDLAQASARSDVVSSEELGEVGQREAPAEDLSGDSDGDDPTEPAVDDGEVVSEPTGEEPDIAELREQLNDQFESIKILEPGQYELNLMELYDREEYIIALQENGRYVIQVPEQWIGEEIDDR